MPKRSTADKHSKRKKRSRRRATDESGSNDSDVPLAMCVHSRGEIPTALFQV